MGRTQLPWRTSLGHVVQKSTYPDAHSQVPLTQLKWLLLPPPHPAVSRHWQAPRSQALKLTGLGAAHSLSARARPEPSTQITTLEVDPVPQDKGEPQLRIHARGCTSTDAHWVRRSEAVQRLLQWGLIDGPETQTSPTLMCTRTKVRRPKSGEPTGTKRCCRAW